MGIDRRLNRLTERHKKLTQSARLSFSSTRQNLSRLERAARENDFRFTVIEGKA
jgi:transcriptional regulator